MSPAPWQTDPSAFGIVYTDLPDCRHVICTASTQANARLIAAAPDMLDALQRAREVLLWNLGDDARVDAAFDAVNAAITKATYTKEQSA